MFCCECCMLSGTGLCDELITRAEESYRLWCVVVCDLETSRMRRLWPALGRSATKKNQCWKIVFFIVLHINWNFGHFYPPYLYNQYILISIQYLYMFCAFSDLCCRSCTNIRLRVCKLKNFILLNIHFAKHVMKRYAIKKILRTQFLIPTWYVTKCNPKLWLCYKWERNTWPFYVSFVQSFPITEKLRLNCSWPIVSARNVVCLKGHTYCLLVHPSAV
jgi:hypothetical protein